MKKIIALALAVIICLSMVACGGNDEGAANGNYKELIEMLNNGEYEAAKIYIDGLAQNAKDDANKEDEKEEDKDSVASHVYGEWVRSYYPEEFKGAVKAQFNDDSTCQIGEKSYTWKFNNEYDTNANFDVYEGKKVVYKVDVYVSEKGDYTLSYSEVTDKGDGSYDWGDYFGDYFCEASYDYVEITVDNLLDYFEWTETEEKFSENSFGEAVSVYFNKYLKMKQEYAEKLYKVADDLAIEISYESYKVPVEVDYANRTCKKGDKLEKTSTEPYTETLSGYYTGEGEYSLSVSDGYYSEWDQTISGIKGDMEVLRAIGQFYFRK